MSAYSNPQPDPDDPAISRFKAAMLGRGASGTLLWFLILTGAIIALTLIANRCDDDDDGGTQAVATEEAVEPAEEATTEPTPAPTAEPTPEPTPTPDPAAVEVVVDGGAVVLRGSVPDQATADALLAAAEAAFGSGNVTSELTIDPETTADGATIVLSGSADADAGDALADGLADALAGAAVDNQLDALAPLQVDASLDGGTAVLSGTVPDQATADALLAAAEEVLGEGRVTSELVIDPAVTAAGASLTLSGEVEEATGAALRAAFGEVFPDATIADDGLSVIASADVVGDLNALFAANPVQFALGSAAILDESVPILDQVATSLAEAPALALEIQGHTDDSGSAEANQLLSQDRAQAVLDYLVAAGVSDNRLTAVGFGEDQPIADNSTPEGQQQNRRIEFAIIG